MLIVIMDEYNTILLYDKSKVGLMALCSTLPRDVVSQKQNVKKVGFHTNG
jgi:hypothetical protein